MYYEIEIQTDVEGKDSKGVYAYNEKDKAIAVYHQKMASGITAGIEGKLNKVMNMVINEQGGTVIKEYWEKVEPTPEPEAE